MCHGGVSEIHAYIAIAPYGSEPETVDNVIARESPQPPAPHVWTWAGYSTSNCIIVGGLLAVCAVIFAVVWRIFLIRRLLRGPSTATDQAAPLDLCKPSQGKSSGCSENIAERGVRRDAAGTSAPIPGKEDANMELGKLQGNPTEILVLAPDGQPTWVAVSDCSSPPASAPSPCLDPIVTGSPTLGSSQRRPSSDAANVDETPTLDSRADAARVSLTRAGDAEREARDPLAGAEAEPASQRVSDQSEVGSSHRAESERRFEARRSGSWQASPGSGAWVSENCTGLGTNCRCLPCVVALHTATSMEEQRIERLRLAGSTGEA